MKKFYITTPIYYPNDRPHLGHAYTTIAADIVARFYRLFGYSVFFSAGLDEHGEKLQKAAEEKGIEPQQFVDEMAKFFVNAWKILNISYDDFIRTSEKRHEKAVIDIFNRLNKAGDIYKGEYEGWYCTPCESYWTETQLEGGKCPSCRRDVKLLKEESYFFKLSKYQKKLLELYKKEPNFISPANRRPEIIARVREGLHDLSVSRKKVKWAIPVPINKEAYIYVWIDALTNYLTTIGYPDEKYKKYWPADLHMMAKEILWFHSVIWPAMLMSAKLPLPKKVFAHGWLTVEGEKMSKSLGNFIIPEDMVKKYGVDVFRYYLMRDIPLGDDGDFSEKSLIARANDELNDNYGNLFYRVTSFIEKNFKEVPKPEKMKENDTIMEKKLAATADKIANLVKEVRLTDALREIMELSSLVNKYFQEKEPWAKIKSDKKEDKQDVSNTLYVSVNMLYGVTSLLLPFIPETAEKAIGLLEMKAAKWKDIKKFSIRPGQKIKSKILLKKLEYKEERPEIKLVAGRIVDVRDHPNADKLYVMNVKIGTSKKQIVAGIKPFYSKEELKGQKIVVVANLKPASLRGIESQGMLLVAGDNVVLIEPEVEDGTVLMKGKGIISFDEFQRHELIIKNNKLYVDGKELSARPIKAVKDGEKVR